MTDKELIKQEIERIIEKETPISKGSDYYHGTKESMEKLLQFIDSLLEEPASEDLEEATHKYSREWYAKRIGTNPKCNGCYSHIKDAFTAGAKWQKQQIMKDAVEGVIDIRKWPAKAQVEFYDRLPDFDVRTGDKVKIIIIVKEEQQ